MTDTTPATRLELAAPSAPLVDTARRTISGLAVPYGPTGQTSMGLLRFGPGALTWASPRRVKLLREHDQRDALGHALSLEELGADEVDRRLVAGGQDPVGFGGLWASYRVPEGANGDQALAEAANGVRDALSVGVQLDAASQAALRKAAASGGTQAVQASGVLRETSLVSVPAFDDARVGSVAAHAELVVASWHPTTPTEGTTAMQPLATATTPTTDPQPQQPTPAPAPQPQPQQPDPAQPTTQPAQPTQAAAAPLAVAGAALMVGGEPATYRFDGTDSLVVDAARAHFLGDFDSRQRMARFNAELAAGNPASVMALAAVMQTTDPDAAPLINPAVTNRADLLRAAIDRGRPINSRITTIPLRNANPFVIPVEGEYVGIADHVEGTAHAPEGTLTMDDSPVVTPKAVSGAFRMSRELVDSTNPAIDRIAMRAMLRAYRKDTEARAYAALGAAVDAVGGITGVQDVRTQLIDFIDDDTEVSFILVGKQFLTTLANDLDGDGRPLLPFTGPTNAPGTIRAGYTGADIDGNPLVKSTGITTTRALIVDADDVLVGESPVQQFRFEEVEGPGVIKLALWAYYVAAVLDATGVRELATDAEPVA